MAVFQSKEKKTTLDQAVKAALDTESWQISETRRAPVPKLRATTGCDPVPDCLEENRMSAQAMRSGEHKPNAKWTVELKTILSEFLDNLPNRKWKLQNQPTLRSKGHPSDAITVIS